MILGKRFPVTKAKSKRKQKLMDAPPIKETFKENFETIGSKGTTVIAKATQ